MEQPVNTSSPTSAAAPSFTAFDGTRRIAGGTLPAVALVVRLALSRGAAGPIAIFDDATGRQIDIDTRGSEEDMLSRLPAAHQPAAPESPANAPDEPRSRGRPRLGVVAREVTLLPRHWEWLGAQPGGASVALRRLVEAARRANAGRELRRHSQERAYAFMSAMAGDMPGFEEGSRALFADDHARLQEQVAAWPTDVREYALRLAFPGGHAEADTA